jgi:hypothetical protein
MGRRIDPMEYIGKKYNRWTIKAYRGYNNLGKHTYLCQCECGKEKIVVLGNLKSGTSKSCGCLNDESRKGNTRNKKHGMSFSREYHTWRAMLDRCECTTHREYPMWGGRGIKICERWHDFNNFYADMGKRPPNTTLDRIDNNGNYEPTNCRWADAKTQANNKRSNTLITYEGRTQTLQQWADEVGIGATTIHNRISNLGWSVEEAMTRKPSHASRKYDKVVS